MLNAKLLLSGVNNTSNVVAPMPLLSIHVAKEFDPICLIACIGCMKERHMMEKRREGEMMDEEDETFMVRLDRDNKRIVYCIYLVGKGVEKRREGLKGEEK